MGGPGEAPSAARDTTIYLIEVGDTKEIETPAGKFRATPISYMLPRSASLVSTEWYAEGVGMVREVYANGTVTRELKSFAPGKGEVKNDNSKKDK